MGNCWRRLLHCFGLFQQPETTEKKPLLGENDDEDEGSSVDPPTFPQHASQEVVYGSTDDILETTDTMPLLVSAAVDDPISIDHLPDATDSSLCAGVPASPDFTWTETDSINARKHEETASGSVYHKTQHIGNGKDILSDMQTLEGVPVIPAAEMLGFGMHGSENETLDSKVESTSLLKEEDLVCPSEPISILLPQNLDSGGHSMPSGESSLVAEHDEKFSPFGEEWDKIALSRTKSARVKPAAGSPKFPKYRRLGSEPQLLPETKENEREDETESTAFASPTKRQLTAMELLQTETTYLRNLKIIIEIYKEPLEKAVADGDPILAPEDIRNIFGGISDILEVHEQMHQDLSAVISDWKEDCSIAEIITKYQGQLTNVYPNYVNYFDMGKDIIHKQKKANPRFLEFLTNCFNNPTCLKQPLDALLIRPVQRLPSMALLISDLQRRTPEDIQDHAELEKAKESLKQVLSHINEDKRKTEGKMKIFDIIYEVEHCPVDIVSSNRLFVARVNVTSLNAGLYRAGDRLAIYLLTDTILVSKFKRAAGNFLLKHVRMIPLLDIKLVIDINDSEESDNLFAIQLVDEPSEKSKIQENAYHDANMDNMCICQVLDDRTYKEDFLKKLRDQIEATKVEINDENVLKKMDPSEVQPMLKRGGSRVFRRGRSKPKRD